MHTYYLIKRKENEKKINIDLEEMAVHDTGRRTKEENTTTCGN